MKLKKEEEEVNERKKTKTQLLSDKMIKLIILIILNHGRN